MYSLVSISDQVKSKTNHLTTSQHIESDVDLSDMVICLQEESSKRTKLTIKCLVACTQHSEQAKQQVITAKGKSKQLL